MKRVAFAILAVLVLSLAPHRSWAQDGAPPVPVDEFGTPDMSQIELTHVGEYTDCILCINFPGLGEAGLILTYDLYADNYGNTWVVPNTFTALYAAITGYVPPGMDGDVAYYHASGLGNMVGMLGGYEALGITTEMAEQALGRRVEAWDALGEGDVQTVLAYAGGEVSFWLNLNARMLLSDPGEWRTADWLMMYIYEDDPLPSLDIPGTVTPEPTGISPTCTPRPTPTARPTATPISTPVDCPPESISQRPPVALIGETWPPNPVVVGQGGQGLNISVRVVSYPVSHRWWTREQRSTTECVWHGNHVTGEPDESICECTPDRSPGCWPGWGWETTTEWYCQEHVEVIPDPIEADALQGHARLHETSIEWIRTDLANKYPGARVRHPNWDVQSDARPVLLSDGRCFVQTTLRFGFEDPGWYDVWVDGWTVGTRYTPPRTYDYRMPDPQPVYLIDTSLTYYP